MGVFDSCCFLELSLSKNKVTRLLNTKRKRDYMKKRLASLALALVLCLSLGVSAMATEIVNEDDISFTPEEIAEQIAIDSLLRAKASNFMPAPNQRARVVFSAPVTSCQQINTYYCGPATTKMVYEGITGDTSHNQQWFASQLGTTTA